MSQAAPQGWGGQSEYDNDRKPESNQKGGPKQAVPSTTDKQGERRSGIDKYLEQEVVERRNIRVVVVRRFSRLHQSEDEDAECSFQSSVSPSGMRRPWMAVKFVWQLFDGVAVASAAQ